MTVNNLEEDASVAANAAGTDLPIGTPRSQRKNPVSYKERNAREGAPKIKSFKEWIENGSTAST